jgi:chemotaxis protein MotB
VRERRKNNISRDRWLVSYADFITLLFGLFVVLFAFAKADQKQQAQVSTAINTAFQSLGIFPHVSRHPVNGASGASGTEKALIPMNIIMGEEVMSPARVKDELGAIGRDLEQKLSNQVATHTVSIQMGRDGLVISLREAGFFDSGSATPKPETLPTLRQIAASLSSAPYDLRIEGHTDNIPIHTAEFDSNWELSSARATRIARLLLDMKAISPERISAAGYAEFHPVATNDTAQGRSENRRIDLVVLPRTKVDFRVPGFASSNGEWRKITDGDPPAQEAAPSPSNP